MAHNLWYNHWGQVNAGDAGAADPRVYPEYHVSLNWAVAIVQASLLHEAFRGSAEPRPLCRPYYLPVVGSAPGCAVSCIWSIPCPRRSGYPYQDIEPQAIY